VLFWLRDKALAFKAELKAEIREAAAPGMPSALQQSRLPHELHAEDARRFVDQLSRAQQDQLRILSYMSDPRSYQFAEYLTKLFTAGGWTVQHDADPIAAPSPGLRIAVPNINNMPNAAKTVAKTLSAAGMSFVVEKVTTQENWCLLVGRSM
jgi:hypothetical protein